MVVALVALVAALAGTAVALPGSNPVTSGDIRNGALKTQDIANSTVRGRDVRNNTVTGSDVNESSLGRVPSAATAGAANTANIAGRPRAARPGSSAAARPGRMRIRTCRSSRSPAGASAFAAAPPSRSAATTPR
jgi:hypothetical protein